MRGGRLPGAGTYVAPSLNHAGCVITTGGVYSFLFYCRRVGVYSCKLVCASRMRAGTLAIFLVYVSCQILEQDG